MTKTAIEWADWTWNPWVGCEPVSEGCDNCYARREEDGRFRHLGRCSGPRNDIVRIDPYFWCGPVYQGDETLNAPLRWRRPRVVFVCSRSDLFHQDIPDDDLDRAFAVMACSPRHTFIVLTKRATRMASYMKNAAWGIADNIRAMRCAAGHQDVVTPIGWRDPGEEWYPLPNVILMVTAENQKRADERIPDLLATPAICRGVSLEPLLGPVDLDRYLPHVSAAKEPGYLDWPIVGGESGPGARPMHPDWVRSIRDNCVAAKVPFFFKQWGEYAPDWLVPDIIKHRFHDRYTYGKSQCKPELIRYCAPNTDFVPAGDGLSDPNRINMYRVGKKRAGRILDGREWSELPKIAGEPA